MQSAIEWRFGAERVDAERELERRPTFSIFSRRRCLAQNRRGDKKKRQS